jgi:hypothetical protein
MAKRKIKKQLVKKPVLKKRAFTKKELEKQFLLDLESQSGVITKRKGKKELEKLFLNDFEEVSGIKKEINSSIGKIEITRQKKGKKGLIITDKGKRISKVKFKKKFNLTDTELKHLESNQVNKLTSGNIEKYFAYFNNNRNFEQLVDTRNLEDIEKYKIIYNGKKIPFDILLAFIMQYEDSISGDYYKMCLMVKVSNGIAYIKLNNEIINFDRRREEGEEDLVYAYTDKNGNFILYKS